MQTFGNNPCSKPHIVRINKTASISIIVNNTEIHRARVIIGVAVTLNNYSM